MTYSSPLPPSALSNRNRSRKDYLLSIYALISHIQSTPTFTNSSIESLHLWNKENTRQYLRILHDQKIIHISGWIYASNRGRPTRIFSYGNKSDVPYVPKTDHNHSRRAKYSAIARMASTQQSIFPT